MIYPTRICVENFRAIKHIETDLPLLLEVVGPNESGKTSLCQAIEFLLTGSVLDDHGARIDQGKLKHHGEPISVTMQFEDDQGAGFAVRRELGSKHAIALVRDEVEVAIPVSEWEEHCRLLFGADTEALRATLRTDRFLSMTQPQQIALVCRLLRVRVGPEQLLEVLAEDDRSIGQALLEAEDAEGAALLEKAGALAVGNRRAAKKREKDAEGRVAVCEQQLRERKEDGRVWRDETRAPYEAVEAADDDERVVREWEKRRRDLRLRLQTAEGAAAEALKRTEELEAQIAAAQERIAAADAERRAWEAKRAALTAERDAAEEDRLRWISAREPLEQEIVDVRRALDEERAEKRRAEAVLTAIGDEASAECFVCRQPADMSGVAERTRKRLAEINERIVALDAQQCELAELIEGDRREEQAAEARRAMAQRALDGMATPPPSADEIRRAMIDLRAQRDQSAQRRDLAAGECAAIEAQLVDVPSQEELEHRLRLVAEFRELALRVETAAADLKRAREALEMARAERAAAERVADAWAPTGLAAKIVVPQMRDALALLNDVLAPKGWNVRLGDDMQTVVETGDAVWSPDELSKGAAVVLAAAWQVAFARSVGFGLVLLDDAALLDADNLRLFGDAALTLGGGIKFVVARHATEPCEYMASGIMLAGGEVAQQQAARGKD